MLGTGQDQFKGGGIPMLIFYVGLLLLASAAFVAGRSKAIALLAGRPGSMHSLPFYHGAYVALFALIAAGLVYGAATAAAFPYGQYAGLFAAAAASAYALPKIAPDFRTRNTVERIVLAILALSSGFAILITVGIVLSVLFEALVFFSQVSPVSFIAGLQWSPTSEPASFGFIPLLVGTLLITLIAIIIAGPLGLFSAIYMAEYASPRMRAYTKPILEMLAGVPTVVLGFFAALTVAPLIRGWGEAFGLSVSSESALAAGVVMGMMIVPLISSLSDDVINAVPQSLRDGSYALGATRSETIRRVVLPAALPGIVSAFILAISRAIGETMIVVMAAGLAANLSFNPLDAVTTITVQIATLLVGDQEFDSAKTLSAFALGLVLFLITLGLNYVALRVVQKYREQYD